MVKSNGRNRAARSRHDDSSLREDLEEINAQIAKLASKGWGEGQEMVAAEIERLRDGVEAVVGRVRERGEDTYEQVTDFVQRRPAASLFAAFAAGLLIAVTLSRRSHQ